MKLKKYSVFGTCDCGCEGTFLYRVRALNGHVAIEKVRELRSLPGTVVAVCKGWIESVITEKVVL